MMLFEFLQTNHYLKAATPIPITVLLLKGFVPLASNIIFYQLHYSQVNTDSKF
jgi:hypothetical protein